MNSAIATAIAVAGRPSSVDQQACRAAIVQLLAGTSLATADLVLRTGHVEHVIKHECARLKAAGTIVSFGVARGSRWCLPGYVVPAPMPAPLQAVAPAPVKKFRPPSLSIRPSPESRVLQGSSSGTIPPAQFASLVRPATVPAAVDAAGASWWTAHADPTLPRANFTAAAQQRDRAMCASSQAWRSPRGVNTVSLT